MTTESLATQVKGLEVQLAVLKARLREVSAPTQGYSFADLEGTLSGVTESTYEEIEAVEYRDDWDDEGAGQ